MFSKMTVWLFAATKPIPLTWWFPQKERALLAAAGVLFWGGSIMQALQKDTQGASILALYGLGLLYLVSSLANVVSGAKRALQQFTAHKTNNEQSRALLQLFLILAVMFLLNIVVLGIYLLRGIEITRLDILSIIAALLVAILLAVRFGTSQLFRDPFARGYLALAFKALPQSLLAYLFVKHPVMASALTIWALSGILAMAVLRFLPGFLAFRRDPKSLPLRGLLIGESGNIASVAFMILAWCYATLLV